MHFARKIFVSCLFAIVFCFTWSCGQPSFDIVVEDPVRLGMNSANLPLIQSKILSASDQKILAWYGSGQSERSSFELKLKSYEFMEWDITTEQPQFLFQTSINPLSFQIMDATLGSQPKQAMLLYKQNVANSGFIFGVKQIDLVAKAESVNPIYSSLNFSDPYDQTQATFAQSQGFFFFTTYQTKNNAQAFTIVRLTDQQSKEFKLSEIFKNSMVDYSKYFDHLQMIATKDASKLFFVHANGTKILPISLELDPFNLVLGKEIDVSALGSIGYMTFRNDKLVTSHFTKGGDYQVVEWDASLSTQKQIFSMAKPQTLPYTEITFSEDGKILLLKNPKYLIQLWQLSTASFLPKLLGGHSSSLVQVIPIDNNKVVIRQGYNPSFANDYNFDTSYLWEWEPSQKRPLLRKEISHPLPQNLYDHHQETWGLPGPLGGKTVTVFSYRYNPNPKNEWNLHILNEQAEFVTFNQNRLYAENGDLASYGWQPIYFTESLDNKQPLLFINNTKTNKIYRYFGDFQKQEFVKDLDFEIPSIGSQIVTLSPSQKCLASYEVQDNFNIKSAHIKIACQGDTTARDVVLPPKSSDTQYKAQQLLWSPGGQWIYLATEKGAGIVDILTNDPSAKTLQGWELTNEQRFLGASWLDENVVITVQANGNITIWNAQDGSVLKQTKIPGSLNQVSFLDTDTGKVAFLISGDYNSSSPSDINSVTRVFINRL